MSNNPKRILVCGGREWPLTEPIRRILKQYPRGTVLIHGACRGADLMAAEVGKELGFVIESFPAHWSRYGRGAGPIRNTLMLNEGMPDKVYAFHEDITKSVGTKHMIKITKAAGIEYEIISL